MENIIGTYFLFSYSPHLVLKPYSVSSFAFFFYFYFSLCLQSCPPACQQVYTDEYFDYFPLTFQGAYKGPWVQSETMAIIFAILIYYYAFTLKAKLVA